MKKPALGGLRLLVIRFPMRSTRHYAVLGAYLGAFAFLAQVAKDWRNASLAVQQGDLWGLVLLLLLFCLCGYGIGWCIGRLKAYAEKRRRSRDESLVVRR